VQLVEGDMRRFAIDRSFSLVTIPYRAFLHNLDVEDQLQTLGESESIWPTMGG